MPDDAHAMGLPALGIDSVAHCFAIDGQTLVGFAMGCLPALERSVKLIRRDADEQIANHIFTRDHAAAVHEPTTESCTGLGAQTLDPVRHGLVAPHPTQCGSGSQRKHRWEGMPAPLGAAGIGDGGKARGQQSHLVGSQHDRRSSMAIRGFKNGPSQQGLGPWGARGRQRPSWGCGPVDYSRVGCAESLGCRPRSASSSRGTASLETGWDRQRFPAGAADAQSAPANRPIAVVGITPACARPRWADARWAE